jgi:hypothetical protein
MLFLLSPLKILSAGLPTAVAIFHPIENRYKATANDLVGVELPGLIFQYCDLEGKSFLRTDGKLFYRLTAILD